MGESEKEICGILHLTKPTKTHPICFMTNWYISWKGGL